MTKTKCGLAAFLVACVLVILYVSTSVMMKSHSFDNIQSLTYAAAQNNDSELDSPRGEDPHYQNLLSKIHYVESCSYTWKRQ